MKKVFYFLGFLALSALIRQAFVPKSPTKEQLEQTVIEVLRKTSAEINKQTPRMIDNETRLERTEAGPGARFTYFYTLINYASTDVNPSLLREKIEFSLWSGVCQNKGMLTAIQNGATYVYAINGNDNTEINRFVYNKNECSQGRVVKTP